MSALLLLLSVSGPLAIGGSDAVALQVYDAVVEPVGGSPSAVTRLRVHVPDEDGLTILVPLR